MYTPFLGENCSSGMLCQYYDVLCNMADIDSKFGNDIQLTIDSTLQESTYRILEEFVGTTDCQASAVVTDAETGEIFSMVSFPPESSKASIILGDPQFPGSTFKILTTIAILENGYENYHRIDKPFRITDTNDYDYNEEEAEEFVINYHNEQSEESIDYNQAIISSSNIFFAGAMLDMDNGITKLTDVVKRLHIGFDDKGSNRRALDFGSVVSIWGFDKLKQTGKYYYEGEQPDKRYERGVADISYGQGETRLATIIENMIASAIINDGKAYIPYMVKSVINPDKKDILKSVIKDYGMSELKEHGTFIQLTDKDIAGKIKNAMWNAGAEYQMNRNIGTKSGTAEVSEDLDNIWIMSFCEVNGHKYSVVMNRINEEADKRTGSSWAKEQMANGYSALENIYNEIEKLERG